MDPFFCFWTQYSPKNVPDPVWPRLLGADLHGRIETTWSWESPESPGQPRTLAQRRRPIAEGEWEYPNSANLLSDLRWATHHALTGLAADHTSAGLDTFALEQDIRTAFSNGTLGLVRGRDFLMVAGIAHTGHRPAIRPNAFLEDARSSTSLAWRSSWNVPEGYVDLDLRTIGTIATGILYEPEEMSAHARLQQRRRMDEDWALVAALWAQHGYTPGPRVDLVNRGPR